MNENPYDSLPKSAFWKTGVEQENPHAIDGIYQKKFDIKQVDKIATAGSCFAQHISKHLTDSGYSVLNLEPAPKGLPHELHHKFGYSMYSCRYGNIYTVRQLLQLTREASGEWMPSDFVWQKNGRYFDALRPAVEPDGQESYDDVLKHREYHVGMVRKMFSQMDVFIFTLGLTETWIHKESGTVYPTAPGTIVGEFDDSKYEFKNFDFEEIRQDFNEFRQAVRNIRNGRPFRTILTVSPVPLTATASGKHVLLATTYSKSVLRAVAGQISIRQPDVDYFPSYEIVTNPRLHSTSYSNNLRSIRDAAVNTVMNHFSKQHPTFTSNHNSDQKNNRLSVEDIQCEEAILESFSK